MTHEEARKYRGRYVRVVYGRTLRAHGVVTQVANDRMYVKAELPVPQEVSIPLALIKKVFTDE